MISGSPNRKRFPIFWVAGIFFLILGGCSGDVSDEDGITLADGTGAEDTGAGAFSVRWEDLTVQEGDSQERFLAQDEPINCAETGVAEVYAEVYNETGRQVATGGPWPCDLHSGTIRGIPAGDNRKFVVKGVSTEGEPYFVGEVADVTILPGTTTSLGMVEMAANIYVESGKLQYRTYPDADRDRYNGDIDLSKAGRVFVPDDIQKFELRDNAGSIIPIQAPRYTKYTYFEGTLDTGTGYVSLSESKTASGFSIRFPPDISLPAGNYMYEISTKSGKKILHPMSFPGRFEIQPINQSSMQYEWLEDGGLRLSWQNPSDAHTTTSMWMSDENWKDLFYIRIPPEVEEITIPAQEISKITNERGPISTKWTLRVGIRDEEGMEYARAYSDTIEFDWNEVTLDLLDYWPLTQGSTWNSRTNWGENGLSMIVMEDFENIKGTDAIQRTHYHSGYHPISADDSFFWSYNSESLYVHGERQISDDSDDDIVGLHLYTPPQTVKRFLKLYETFSSEWTKISPDGTQYPSSFTWENLGFENVSTPAGYFPNCLKVKLTEIGDEYSESFMWLAKGIGEVQEEELMPDSDWEGLLSANIVGYTENITFPWMPQFQYRIYSDSSKNQFAGWLALQKNGALTQEEDIATLELRRSDYTLLPIERIIHSQDATFDANWNYEEDRFDFSGPQFYSGLGAYFPENSDFPTGHYVWEVTTSAGDVVTRPFYFPGKRDLPVPDAHLMNYQWLPDGSLSLSWTNPPGEYDRVQVALRKPDNTDLFYSRFDSSLGIEEMVIPPWVIDSLTELHSPQTALWTMRTRVHSDEGMMYARAYSDEVEILWQTVDSIFPMIYGASDTESFIKRFSINNNFEEKIEISEVINPYGITVDNTSKKIYWTDYGSDKIFRADLTGSNVEEIITSDLVFPCGIAVDEINRHIYWTDWGNHTIKRSSLDGTNVEILLDETQIIAPVGITLDVSNGVFYFADEDTYKIQRANLDGSNLTDIAINIPKPHGIVYYQEQQKLYWTNLSENTSAIKSSNTDGTSLTSIVTGVNWAMGITVDTLNNRIYYSRETEIRTCNLDGTDDKVAFSTEHMPFIVFINN